MDVLWRSGKLHGGCGTACCMSCLLCVQVVEIMATALDSLVQGEILQIKTDPEKMLDISSYLRKSYYKTASLITNACKSCALLGGHDFDSEVSAGR